MYRAIICAMAVLSSITVLHGGRTDSNGGHYNRSTGEYHYHHGYSAHDHYDMNGDGIIDCPYTFKDNTSESELDDFSKEYYRVQEERVKNADYTIDSKYISPVRETDFGSFIKSFITNKTAVQITAVVLVAGVLVIIFNKK